MAKKHKPEPIDIASLQPDELNELKSVVKEYLDRKRNVENEIESLKEDLKTLDEEFKEKLDLKTLKLVIKMINLEAQVSFKDTYDTFLEVLKSDEVTGIVLPVNEQEEEQGE